MGFTKLDEGILQSSIMMESSDTFKVWIALLASCGADGISRVSSVFLSSVCRLSQEVTDRAVEVLSSPDPRSRSIDDEGRRIRRVDGGFYVINYQKYREYTYSNNPEAIRKREYRKKGQAAGDMLGHVGTCPGHSASASESSSESSLEEGESEGEQVPENERAYVRAGIKTIFKSIGKLELLDEGLLEFFTRLCWEFRDIDVEEEIKSKFTYWEDHPPADDMNLKLQFRNWFKKARKFKEDHDREARVGKTKNKPA